MAKVKKEAAKGILSFLNRLRPKPKPKKRGRPPKETTKESVIPEEFSVPIRFGRDITAKSLRALGGGSAGKGAIRAGVYGTGLGLGAKALFGDDEDSEPKRRVITPEESTEIETSDKLGDILRERTMTIAAESGRATPVFFDYVKAFPSSYMEKVDRDPEFAKQMMAGFLAMMKPVAGPVPVNPFVAFGEAAMAEGVRQEGEIPDQLKLIETISQDPELLRAYKRFQRESTPTPITQRQADAAAIENIVKEELYGKKYKDKDQVFNIETGLPMSSSALLELYYDSGENLSVLLEKVAASDD
tara:strand:- start:5173 stop:6075 length:903 start_codon:yes stop_codon:yes gene_type:complete